MVTNHGTVDWIVGHRQRQPFATVHLQIWMGAANTVTMGTVPAEQTEVPRLSVAPREFDVEAFVLFNLLETSVLVAGDQDVVGLFVVVLVALLMETKLADVVALVSAKLTLFERLVNRMQHSIC